jgi:hypothetical protein
MTRGGGGVHQKMMDDGDGMEKDIKDQKNHQQFPIQGKKILHPNYYVMF